MCNVLIRVCWLCFGFGRKSNDDKQLLTESKSAGNQLQNKEFYTVHRISSFGRGISHDDDGHSDNEMEKNQIVINKANALWSSRPVLVQPNTEHDGASDADDSRSLQASPVPKKKGHWGKALIKTKRETTKNPPSFQSLASVSMMMLPTITVAGSASLNPNVGEGPTIPVSRSGSLKKKEREVKSLSSSPQGSNKWPKSQSMLNVTYASDNENENSEKNAVDEVAKQYGLDTSLYGNSHLSKSMEAINNARKSMEDFANDSGFIDLPNGTVQFTASYNKVNRKLLIRIEKIEGLAPKGVDRLKYDCIYKLTILPHEKHVKYGKVVPAHSTLNIDESFLFNIKDPTKKVLRISVYDAIYQGKYDAVGHILFYLIDVLNDDQNSHIMKLYRQSIPDVQSGSVRITLTYNRETENLNISVKEAYNLPVYSGKCKSYIKLTQHNVGRKIKEVYSPYVTAAQHVRFDFTLDTKVEWNTLRNNFLVISVKIRGFLKKDVLVGRVILGPFLYAEYGGRMTPWGRALLNSETVSHIFRMYL